MTSSAPPVLDFGAVERSPTGWKSGWSGFLLLRSLREALRNSQSVDLLITTRPIDTLWLFGRIICHAISYQQQDKNSSFLFWQWFFMSVTSKLDSSVDEDRLTMQSLFVQSVACFPPSPFPFSPFLSKFFVQHHFHWSRDDKGNNEPSNPDGNKQLLHSPRHYFVNVGGNLSVPVPINVDNTMLTIPVHLVLFFSFRGKQHD